MPFPPRILVVASLLFVVAGCAQPAMYDPGPANLAGIDLARGPAPSFRSAIAVGSVTLGPDAGVPWRSNVGPAQVQESLAQTLAAAGLAAPAAGRYRLDAVLLTLQRPYAGFAMTVSAQIAWRLTEIAAGSVVYSATLTSLGEASLNDAITNERRLMIAHERAVRANLRMLVEQLYALPEPPLSPSGRR